MFRSLSVSKTALTQGHCGASDRTPAMTPEAITTSTLNFSHFKDCATARHYRLH